MSEMELLHQINVNKAHLENLVKDCRGALTDGRVYEQSCRLDKLIVEYMRLFASHKNQRKLNIV